MRILDLSRVLRGADVCDGALSGPRRRCHQGRAPRPGRRHHRLGEVRTVGTRNTSYFNSANRNKRSVTLDLQSEERAAARELAARSERW